MRYELTITAVAREPKYFNNEEIWRVKEPNGQWIALHKQGKPINGFMLVNLVEKKGSPRPDGTATMYRDAWPLEEQPQPQRVQPAEGWEGKDAGKLAPTPQPPGKPTLSRFLEAIPHILNALPDWSQDVQHARAYAQVLNTCAMAYFDGRMVIDVKGTPVSKQILDAYEEANGQDWQDLGEMDNGR